MLCGDENHALEEVAFLIGEWDFTVSNASFLSSPSDTVSAKIIGEWVVDDGFIILKQADAASWLINRDGVSGEYKVFYFDNRGISRIYDMSYKNNVWKMWRDNQEFSQRFKAEVSKNLKTIHASWDKKFGKGKWEHDFDMTFTKNPADE